MVQLKESVCLGVTCTNYLLLTQTFTLLGTDIRLPGEACGAGLSSKAASELGLWQGMAVSVGMIDAYCGSIGKVLLWLFGCVVVVVVVVVFFSFSTPNTTLPPDVLYYMLSTRVHVSLVWAELMLSLYGILPSTQCLSCELV